MSFFIAIGKLLHGLSPFDSKEFIEAKAYKPIEFEYDDYDLYYKESNKQLTSGELEIEANKVYRKYVE